MIDRYVVIGAAVVAAGAYYWMYMREQDSRQIRMNPKHAEPMPYQRLGKNLNSSHSRRSINIMKEYDPNGALKKRDI